MRKYILVVAAVTLLYTTMVIWADNAPVVPDAIKVRILTIQRDQANMTSEFQSLQSRMTELQQKFQKTQTDMANAQEEAYKAAKVDRKDWTLDLTKLEFVAVPKPVAAPSPASGKQP